MSIASFFTKTISKSIPAIRTLGNKIKHSGQIKNLKEKGSKSINKFGKVPIAVGITTSTSMAALCFSSGNPLLMSLFAIPGSMTYTTLATALVTRGVIKIPSLFMKAMKANSKLYPQNTSIFTMK